MKSLLDIEEINSEYFLSELDADKIILKKRGEILSRIVCSSQTDVSCASPTPDPADPQHCMCTCIGGDPNAVGQGIDPNSTCGA